MMTPAFLICCVLLQTVTPEVIEHAQAGTRALQQGRIEVAIEEFRRVVEMMPDSASGHANLGEAYFQNADYPKAIAELEAALHLNPNLMGARQTLGVALLVQGSAEEALPHLEKTHTPELLGVAYLEAGRLGSAITALRAALDRNPNDEDLLYYFARATALASERTAGQLARLQPDPAAKNGLPDKEKRPVKDVAGLEKELANRPNDPELLLAFSRAAAEASDEAFGKVLQLHADSARAHQILAERHVQGGRLAEAEREYAESLRVKPYSTQVHLALAGVLAAEEKWPAAVAQYRMEEALRPRSPDAFFRLGLLLRQLGDIKSALEQLASADRLRPDTPQILLELGEAAAELKDAGRAESCWKRLLGIDHGSSLAASAHLQLAMLYRSTGNRDQADREQAAYEELKGRR